MGQTLTHGIYLPEEGERNCYNGLASNWSILDGAVGTIAEHTTQIAGKAPLVHTHTKSDITDFPAYGTAAGTICEGNDSRLSDARTPVAHTHTKSDVTDLFNSANTWTGDNTYTETIRYQASYTLGNPPQSEQVQRVIQVIDTAGTNYLAQISTYQATVASGLRFTIRDKFDSNGFSPSGSNRNKHFYFVQNISNQGYLKWDGYIDNSISPLADNTYNLGTSSKKWKTLNGVNPGALSLPDCQVTQSIDRTGWVYDGATYNTVLLATTDTNMTKNGWLYVRMTSTTSSDKLTIKYNSTADRYPTNTFVGTAGFIEAFVPVVADTNIYLVATKDLSFCKFYPCLGNVPSGV